MCGICGQLRAGGASEPGVARMVAALHHRGPDDRGIHLSGDAALGHTRLSIIDLAQGHQPVPNEKRDCWVILNGEIYNYRELREELIGRGHRFATRSDTEVIVHAYEEWGDACVGRLRGMFAFAIWDEPRQRLFAARDHLGQKPFYYVEGPGQFSFASEIKALLALDPALAELDSAALQQYMMLRIVMPPHSMFRKIRKLPPAHTLVFDLEHGLRISRYWDLEYEPKLSGSDEALADRLEQEIVESLKAHIVSDVPIGAFLSGGLDSTLVVALLAKFVLDEPLQTFSGSLAYQEFDEAPYARAVAERYGTIHHEQPIQPSLLRLLPKLVAQLDEPSDPLAVCTYLIAEIARKHVKVVLGGDGGDELFGGYDRYYGNRFAGLYALLPRAIREHVTGALLRQTSAGGWYKSRSNQLIWLHQLSFLEGGERYAASLGYFYFLGSEGDDLFTPEFRVQLAGADPTAPIIAAYEDARAEHPIDRMLHVDSQLRMPDHPVMILDRMTMAHGLEARAPFLDHKLAEFAARLPMRLKVRGRSLRRVQRMLAQRHLPPALLERPKQGFSSALPYMLRDEFSLLYQLFLENANLVSDGILQKAAVDRLLAAQRAGRADHGNRLWLLVNAELWYRIYIRGVSHGDLAAAIAESRDRRSAVA
jgi:asparagine synthase (glutamine-hydrolysing)